MCSLSSASAPPTLLGLRANLCCVCSVNYEPPSRVASSQSAYYRHILHIFDNPTGKTIFPLPLPVYEINTTISEFHEHGKQSTSARELSKPCHEFFSLTCSEKKILLYVVVCVL